MVNGDLHVRVGCDWGGEGEGGECTGEAVENPVRVDDHAECCRGWEMVSTCLYRVVDQHRQVIDVLVCERRDAGAAGGIICPRTELGC
jgi:hypothetical protein